MWISTKERLPADDQECIWYVEKDDLFIVGTREEAKKNLTNKQFKQITSWSPVEMPRKKNEPRYPNVDYSGKIIKK